MSSFENDEDVESTTTTTSSARGSSSSVARERGVYTRPSGAIERGSGFFVPGLEGSRIRLAFGLIVIAVDVATIFATSSSSDDAIRTMEDSGGRTVSEFLAGFYGALLLLQGIIEMRIEGRGRRGGDVIVVNGGVSDYDNDDDGRGNVGGGKGRGVKDNKYADDGALSARTTDVDDLDHIRRMASAIVALTPATEFRYVAEDYGVLYSLGRADDDGVVVDPDDERRFATLVLDAVMLGSRGGERVALPADHPASMGLLPVYARRTVLVQKTNDYRGSRACVLVGSDGLLPAFTRNDLRWIGRLAEYGNLVTMREEISTESN